MLYRSVAVLFVALTLGGLLLAEDTRGTITKIEDGSITVKTGGGSARRRRARRRRSRSPRT